MLKGRGGHIDCLMLELCLRHISLYFIDSLCNICSSILINTVGIIGAVSVFPHLSPNLKPQWSKAVVNKLLNESDKVSYLFSRRHDLH